MRRLDKCNEVHQNETLTKQEEIEDNKWMGTRFKELFMNFIEWLALADFITDFYVLLGLIDSVHIAWASLTIFSMLASFYICHIPYMSFLIDKINKVSYKKQTCK